MNSNTKTALVIGGIVVAVLILLPLIPGIGWQNGGWGMMGGLGMGGGFMFIPMLLFWGLIIWGFVALLRGVSPGGAGHPSQESALEILKRRYARGEIDNTEFEDKKKDLS